MSEILSIEEANERLDKIYQALSEARAVIEFYANKNNFDAYNDFPCELEMLDEKTVNKRFHVGTKAREWLEKWGKE